MSIKEIIKVPNPFLKITAKPVIDIDKNKEFIELFQVFERGADLTADILSLIQLLLARNLLTYFLE